MKLERKEIIYLIQILALLVTIIILLVTIKGYIKCADTMKYFNQSVCEGCRQLQNIGYIKEIGG